MKRISFAFIFAALLAISPAHAAVNIFACEPEWGALAEEIGGSNVEVTIATDGTQDPHYVRARPSLLAAMRDANLVFCAGAGLEAGWLPVLMQQAANAGVQPGQNGFLMATNYVTLIDRPQIVDRSMGDVHAEGNPHVHLHPQNILLIAAALADRLGKIDPVNAAAYQASLAAFSQRWQGLMMQWQASAANLRGTQVVVYHDNWNYLNRWLGFTRVATLEVKPGIPPTPSHLQQVLAQSRAAGVRLILLAPFDRDEAAEWLAAQTGARIVRLPFTVGGDDDSDSLETLFARTLALLQGRAS